jgi:TolB protein
MRIPFLLLLSLVACTTPKVDPGANRPDAEPAMTRHTSSTTGEDKDPALSPDGTSLVFATTAWSRHHDLYEKKIGGNVLTRITRRNSDERFPSIHPLNPDTIAFSSNWHGEWDIFVIRDYRKNPDEWIRVSGEGTEDLHPSWSPDGSRLIYSSTDQFGSGTWMLKMADLTTGKTHVFEGMDGLLPEWNPKDNRIVFQRMRHRDRWFGSIWTLRIEGERVTRLSMIHSGEKWAAINPSWSPDGNRIVFATVGKSVARKDMLNEADDLWIVGANGSLPTRLTTSESADWMPTWSSDGRIYFVSRRRDRNHIWSLLPALP